MKINLLDCTLRDGGYCNNWTFGKQELNYIAKNLVNSQIEYLELGFLVDNANNSEKSLFCDSESICSKLGIIKKENQKIMAMIAFDNDDFNIQTLQPHSTTTIDSLRITFGPGSWINAKTVVHYIQKLDYQIFVNPTHILHYSDLELLHLIDEVNAIKPAGLAIVDTFGSLQTDKLLHLFRLYDYNLDPSIAICFHAHNNLQLAFANAVALINLKSIYTERELILDCSCFGMGRGGGNLPTELIVKHLNSIFKNLRYNLNPILDIIDNCLMSFYSKNPWGYSTAQFLSGSLNLHPNYASYLVNMARLNSVDIFKILKQIKGSKSSNYDEKYIANLYVEFQELNQTDNAMDNLKNKLEGKTVLVIAPGNSLISEQTEISSFITKNSPVVIHINSVYEFPIDFLFVGNQLRYDALNNFDNYNFILTSNIKTNKTHNTNIVNYSDLISKTETNEVDNSGMMALRMLKQINVKKIVLAGFDGFKISGDNYLNDKLKCYIEAENIVVRNASIIRQLNELKKEMDITIITSTMY